mgnify:CR=1 FL=1
MTYKLLFLNIFAFLLLCCTYSNAQIDSFPYLEDFETNINCATTCNASCYFTGGWVNDSTENGNWISYSGATPSTSTGPAYDHTYGNVTGKYLFFETSTPCDNNVTANLISPAFDFSALAALQVSFWYPKELSVDLTYLRGMRAACQSIEI